MPKSEATFADVPADPEIEQVVALRTEVSTGKLTGKEGADPLDVVVVYLEFMGDQAETPEGFRSYVIFTAEDARNLQQQLQVAHTIPTVASQLPSSIVEGTTH